MEADPGFAYNVNMTRACMRHCTSDGDLVVALDLTLTDALIAEGYARDLVNRIQNVRKAKGFEVTDRIKVTVSAHPDIVKAVEGYADYIKSETLAESTKVGAIKDGEQTEWLNGAAVRIDVKLVYSIYTRLKVSFKPPSSIRLT